MKSTNSKMSKLKILEIDPWLTPFEGDLNLRMEKYTTTKKALLDEINSFKNFANGHLFYGFHLVEDGWYYREWAPEAEALYLIGDFNDWNAETHPLQKKEQGYWEIFIPGADSLRHLSKVKVRVKSKGKIRDRISLYIRRTIQDPVTHDFCGQIWMPPEPFKWTDSNYHIDSEKPPFIYEAHVGMAQEKEGIGTFKNLLITYYQE